MKLPNETGAEPPSHRAGKLNARTVPPPRRASTPTFADRLATEWCANMTALVAELRALRQARRRS